MCNSTTFALRHTQISLSGILRHFRPPSRHLLLHTHDTNMEFLQFSGPLLDIFLFFSKTKIFHSHPCTIDFYHFIPLSVTLTLNRGHRVSAKLKPVGFIFSLTFQQIRMKFNTVVKQVELNILIVVLSGIFVVKRKDCWGVIKRNFLQAV